MGDSVLLLAFHDLLKTFIQADATIKSWDAELIHQLGPDRYLQIALTRLDVEKVRIETWGGIVNDVTGLLDHVLEVVETAGSKATDDDGDGEDEEDTPPIPESIVQALHALQEKMKDPAFLDSLEKHGIRIEIDLEGTTTVEGAPDEHPPESRLPHAYTLPDAIVEAMAQGDPAPGEPGSPWRKIGSEHWVRGLTTPEANVEAGEREEPPPGDEGSPWVRVAHNRWVREVPRAVDEV